MKLSNKNYTNNTPAMKGSSYHSAFPSCLCYWLLNVPFVLLSFFPAAGNVILQNEQTFQILGLFLVADYPIVLEPEENYAGIKILQPLANPYYLQAQCWHLMVCRLGQRFDCSRLIVPYWFPYLPTQPHH